MRYIKKQVAFLLLLGVGLSSYAQESVSATGTDANGTGGSVAYSVGQVVYTSTTGVNGSVGQGVQQPYEISVTTGVEETAINLEMDVYPNPTTNYLTLSIIDIELSTFNYQLFNLEGKLVKSNQLTSKKNIVNVEELPTGTYFLKVTDNKQIVKSFKIIKN